MAGKQSASVDRALKRIDTGKVTPYAAAKKEKIALSTIYRALRRRREKSKSS